jgi:hypothetical protein
MRNGAAFSTPSEGEVMGKREFDEYLKKRRADTEVVMQIGWSQKRDTWLQYLSDFYKQVEGFLSEYRESGDVAFNYGEKDISEEFIGQYLAKSLHIRIKDRNVILDPVGTNLIGAKGRVDMIGDAGTVKFVLADKRLGDPSVSVAIKTQAEQREVEEEKEADGVEWAWKIATPPPRIKYIEVNAESFLDALMEVINA